MIMAPITLEKVNKDIQDIKSELHKLSHILDEDFELSKDVKKELSQARKESLNQYVDHEQVLKRFS